MKAFVCYLKKQSPSKQLASGSTGWLELPNGQRMNPGHQYKFNACEPVKMRNWAVIRLLTTSARRLCGSVGGRHGQ
ncbi:phage filamentation protein Fil family protein [Siccibacter colletis]|uniref:phage filamentation protein Fil family protein n=1 Tax=Siccibacter colletis TaxID=1505757 RepID=UPI0004E1032E|nr:phage filamentation protein Fil family protein [Siccibacter colletis]